MSAAAIWHGELATQTSRMRGKKWRLRYFRLTNQSGGRLAEYADVDAFREGGEGSAALTPLAQAIGVVQLGQQQGAMAPSGRLPLSASALRPSLKVAIILADHVLMLEARDAAQLALLLTSLRRVVPPLHVDACEWLRRKGTIKWKTRFYVLTSSGHLVRYSDDTLDNLIGFDDVRLATDVSFVMPTESGPQGWGQQLREAADAGAARRERGASSAMGTNPFLPSSDGADGGGGGGLRGRTGSNDLPSGAAAGSTVLVVTTPLATIEISIDKGAVPSADERSARLGHWHALLEQRIRHRIACEGMDLAQLGPFLVLEAIRSRDFRASRRLRAGVREGGIPPALRTDAWGGFSGAQRRHASDEGMYHRLVAVGTVPLDGAGWSPRFAHGALLDPALERSIIVGSALQGAVGSLDAGAFSDSAHDAAFHRLYDDSETEAGDAEAARSPRGQTPGADLRRKRCRSRRVQRWRLLRAVLLKLGGAACYAGSHVLWLKGLVRLSLRYLAGGNAGAGYGQLAEGSRSGTDSLTSTPIGVAAEGKGSFASAASCSSPLPSLAPTVPAVTLGEEQAFWLVCSIAEDVLPEYFSGDATLTSIDANVFLDLARERFPKFASRIGLRHLAALELPQSLFTLLPRAAAARCLDVVILEMTASQLDAAAVMQRIALALLAHIEKETASEDLEGWANREQEMEQQRQAHSPMSASNVGAALRKAAASVHAEDLMRRAWKSSASALTVPELSQRRAMQWQVVDADAERASHVLDQMRKAVTSVSTLCTQCSKRLTLLSVRISDASDAIRASRVGDPIALEEQLSTLHRSTHALARSSNGALHAVDASRSALAVILPRVPLSDASRETPRDMTTAYMRRMKRHSGELGRVV